MTRDVQTIDYVAALFGESRRVWWERCRNGHVPGAFRVGRRWFVDMNTFWAMNVPTGEASDGQTQPA